MIKKCNIQDRLPIYNFHIPNHLKTTTKNEEEMNIQIDDIPNDFPHLLNDDLFQKGEFWKITNDQGSIIASIGVVDDFVTTFSVDENYRGKGLGSLLFDHVINEFFHKPLKLYVLPDRSIIAYQMYLKRGFRMVKEIINGDYVVHQMIRDPEYMITLN